MTNLLLYFVVDRLDTFTSHESIVDLIETKYPFQFQNATIMKSKTTSLRTHIFIWSSFILLFGILIQVGAQKIVPEIYSSLSYRHIGPPGNRTSAVVGVPGDMNIYYVGAASGGIWLRG